MKVLVIGPLPLPVNGCSYANQVLIKNLKERKLACSIINTNTRVISGKQGSRFSINKALSFVKTYLIIYRVFFANVVYVTPGQTFFGVLKYAPFLVLCMILKTPYIIHLHGSYLGKEYDTLTGIKKKLFYFLISRAAAGIVLSKSLCHNFHRLLPLHKIYIIENFVDQSLISLPVQKNTDQLQILYLSNIMREKGILELLDGLIELKRKNINFHVTIAGALEKGIEYDFKSRCQLLGDNLIYVGMVAGDRKKKILTDANVFVLPTYYIMEGQPICLLEGMATGNIIITTAHAGIPDVVNDTNGFFVKERSSDEIANCLENVSRQLPSMINNFSLHNSKYVSDKFTEQVFTDKILTVLYAAAKA